MMNEKIEGFVAVLIANANPETATAHETVTNHLLIESPPASMKLG